MSQANNETSLKNVKVNWFITFLPGLIILIFGMIALHSSVTLINSRATLEKEHHEYINTFIEFQNDFYAFENEVKTHLSKLKNSNFTEIKSKFSKINDDFLRIRSKYSHHAVHNRDEDAHMLYLVGAGIQNIADAMVGYEKISKKQSAKQTEIKIQENALLAQIDETFQIVLWAQQTVLKSYQNTLIAESIETKEKRLYWSVAAMGLLGFVLVLFNGQKLYELKQTNTDRLKAIAEKQEMEEQFYQAQKMEAIGRLAGGIAHDFNNILAAMNGYAEFLIDDLKEGSDQHKFAKNILCAGVQAKDLVDQVLTFSRRSDSSQEVVNAALIITEVQTMISATISKSIELESKIPTDEVVVFANSTQVSQIMMNLCVNAIDAMEDEHGVLSISIEQISSEKILTEDVFGEDLPDPKAVAIVKIEEESPLRTKLVLGHIVQSIQYAKITVSDTGTGMSKSVMEHVFEPFFTTKSVEEGTGLGLATVHGVVVSHRGMLIIDSELGTGTTFEIYFPIHQNDEMTETETVHQEENDDQSITSEQKRILVVEDQDVVLDMTMKMLDRMGYEAHYARNGMEGLDIVRENPGAFDLIITDYNMPKMSGLEMMQQIHCDFPDLPAVILSGYSEDKIRALLKEHPSVKAMLRKPVNKEDLASCLNKVFT